jgi:hypothetical protein
MAAIRYETLSYNGKDFSIPVFPPGEGFIIDPSHRPRPLAPPAADSPLLRRMNTVWDLARFLEPAPPLQCGLLSEEERRRFSAPGPGPNVLDMPIKFPGIAEYRVPAAYEQFRPVLERVADFEAAVNPLWNDYYCYLTLRRGPVKAGTAHHEAPCHVDGFQGARWNPKVRVNHTYTVTDCLPTVYYVQPFDFAGLDEARHDFFWEMNCQVADTNSAHAWTGAPYVIELMDAYCVHRAAEAETDQERTWLRLSFEVRVFDRLGNAHNPLFDYAWEMVPRDIEALGLVSFRPDCDPTLRVFPWQAPDGSANPPGVRTKPNLRPRG